MSEETNVETPEVESSRTQESLDAFQAMLDSRPDEPVQDELDETEQPAETADDDAGVEPTDDSPESEEPAAEGPSATLKTVARQAKVPAELVAIARDDQQLQAIIDAHLDAQEAGEGQEESEAEPEQPPEPEKDFFEFPIAEDEFDESDPVHKAFKAHVTRSNELVKDLQGKLGLFARFANEQLKREQDREQAQQQELSRKFYGPLDAVLDDYGSDVFGKYGSLTKSQQSVREKIAEKYAGLATLDADDDEKARLAELAVRAYSRDIADRRDKVLESEKQQPRQRTGGGGSVRPSAPPPRSRQEKIEAFDQYRRQREANGARV